MPYKWETQKMKVAKEDDKRIKLTNEQKDEIRHRYLTEGIGQRPLAKEYNVSRSTIQLIVNPETEKAVKERRKAHSKDYAVTKEENAKIVRDFRRRKNELYLQGKLK